MPILHPADLNNSLYPEIIEEITRGDQTMVVAAIATAEQEAKMYLTRFDTAVLFGDANTAPVATDPLLQQLVRHIACWQLCQVAQPGITYERLRIAYTDSLHTLQQIKEGALQPEGWPYAPIPSEPTDGDTFYWNSQPKRNNSY